MDEFQRAILRTQKRRERVGFVSKEVKEVMPEPVVIHERKEESVPVLLQPKVKQGKTKIEVRIWLSDEPMVFTWMAEMKTHMLHSQLNRKWLGDKIKELFRVFGRLHDVS